MVVIGYPEFTMAKLNSFVSATIVAFLLISLCEAHGAPGAPTFEDKPDAASPTGTFQPATPRLQDDMAVAPAPQEPMTAMPARGEADYYPYQQALIVRAGKSTNLPKIALNDSVLGFAYLFPKFLSPKLEAGADLHEYGRGHVHAGVRWIYFERSLFRPSVKAGLDHFFDANYGLGTLARREDWYARGSATLEYALANPYSLRLELEMLINFDHTFMVGTLGISRGW